MSATAFDRLASRYDKLWTLSSIGRHQRAAVWRVLDPLIRPGDFVLDLGCGTGEDALHFLSRGAHVHALDASAEMIRIAREKGVDASISPSSAVAFLDPHRSLRAAMIILVNPRATKPKNRRFPLAILSIGALRRLCHPRPGRRHHA